MNYNFFNNKKILLTGHTGFKGSWLACWLSLLGSKVLGISLKPEKHSHFNLIKNKIKIKNKFFDIRDEKKLKKTIINFKPDIVFHLTTQAIVSNSFNKPKFTYETNVIGIFNILNSLSFLKKKCSAVIITSDKCYKNKELKRGYHEKDELGGTDFYSSSKASAEILFSSFFRSFLYNKNPFLRVATARAGNVVGGGDWSKDRLIPDCMRMWSKNKVVEIRNPKSTRPWQHVLEALNGYLILAYNLYKNKKNNGESFNFSNSQITNYSVKKFIKKISIKFKNAKWRIKKSGKFKESNLLQLNNNKSKKVLKWKNKMKINETIEFVSEWYYSFYKKQKKVLTFQQIKKFMEL